jgi:hypothetical protein
LEVLRPEVERAETLLRIAAQRTAQVNYGRGMLLGVAGLFVLCALLAGAFYLGDVPAEYGVALPAGALGAIVSVLQRMTSGSLRLDFNAGTTMLTTFGAVRPIVGAIFGMAIFALLKGGVSIEVTTDAPLAFYAAVGFLGGLNERFAQDMLVGSAKELTRQLGPGEAPAANASTAAVRDSRDTV